MFCQPVGFPDASDNVAVAWSCLLSSLPGSVGSDDLMMAPVVSVDVERALDDPNALIVECISNSPGPDSLITACTLEMAVTLEIAAVMSQVPLAHILGVHGVRTAISSCLSDAGGFLSHSIIDFPNTGITYNGGWCSATIPR